MFYYNHYNDKDCYNNLNDNFNHDDCENERKSKCCIKKVKETWFCYPSYYEEDKEKNECFEGYFKICPKHNINNNNNNDNCNDRKKHCCFCNHFTRW